MSIISCTSPSPSDGILPTSIDTSRPSSALCARSSSPSSRTSSPRFGAGTRRQAWKALWAASMVFAAPAGEIVFSAAICSPVTGLRTIRSPPESASSATPSFASNPAVSFAIVIFFPFQIPSLIMHVAQKCTAVLGQQTCQSLVPCRPCTDRHIRRCHGVALLVSGKNRHPGMV